MKARKDHRGRGLRKGELVRKDGRYSYTYTDPLGRRKWIYANELSVLREKEKELFKNQLDGLDLYARGKATLNNTFDRYMAIRYDLAATTKSNYQYLYAHFVEYSFGKKKIIDIRYSDVLNFYLYLINEKNISLGTLDSIHHLLHPVFQLAVRDNIILKNPSDGALREISRKAGKNKGVRHALTPEQQSTLMNYTAQHPIFNHWWPLLTVMLGTGARIGEVLGLRWEDIDIEKRTISINHAIVYYPVGKNRKSVMRVSQPKTEAGIRTIPMLDIVKEAFLLEKDFQEFEFGGLNQQEIDGMTGFIFQNRYGKVPNPQSVNDAIHRITNSYNANEQLAAAKKGVQPFLLPSFTCHHLRHTFASRLCEVETNLKIIQDIMGHKNIETTMDIYAEATEKGKRESLEKLQNKLDNIF